MSINECEAGFSHSERKKFMDKPTSLAIDRIEFKAILLKAEIPGLARCPFCDFAADYPPISVQKEFQCQHPSCRVISCRSCNAEAHYYRTCEEVKRGPDGMRSVEEAMSTALIRKCNKCDWFLLQQLL